MGRMLRITRAAYGLPVLLENECTTSKTAHSSSIHMDTKKVDTILKHLGIDSVDIQDSITTEVMAYLASKRIEATVVGIRWNTVVLAATARNAELLKWEQDILSSRVSSLVGADYTFKIRVVR